MLVVRLLLNRNEGDVLRANLDWYCALGITTVAVDDGSSDDSLDILRAARADGVITQLITLPAEEEIDIRRSLRAGMEAANRLRPDAVLLTAADEFFEVGDGTNLLEAMSADFRDGYNVLDFKNIQFYMTERDDPNDTNAVTRMRHYAHVRVTMLRAFVWSDGVELTTHFGHRPKFPDDAPYRISPRLYVSRHYTIRSRDQLARKVARFRPTTRAPSAHSHYLTYRLAPKDPAVASNQLHEYRDDHSWELSEVAGLRLFANHANDAMVAADWKIRQLEARLVRSLNVVERTLPELSPDEPTATVPLGSLVVETIGRGWSGVECRLPGLCASKVWLVGTLETQPAHVSPDLMALFQDERLDVRWCVRVRPTVSDSPSILAACNLDQPAGDTPIAITGLTLQVKSARETRVAFGELRVVCVLSSELGSAALAHGDDRSRGPSR